MKAIPKPTQTYPVAFYRGYHIRMDDYETTKKKYESVKPLIGQRVKHGITDHRPLTDRHRTFEVWHRDGDRYGMAFAMVYPTNHQRDPKTGKTTVTSYYKEYKPLLMAYPDGRFEFTPQWMSNYVTWHTLGALLPTGLSFARFGTKQYIVADQPDGTKKYYFQDGQHMRFVPYESNGKRFFEVIGGLAEHKLLIDTEKAKKVRQELKPFLDYYEIMSPFVTTDENLVSTWSFRHDMRERLDQANWLVRQDGEEYGEKWMNMVEALFHTHTEFNHSWDNGKHEVQITYPDRQKLEHKLRGAYLYQLTKPFKQVAVDVGVPFYSNGRRIK